MFTDEVRFIALILDGSNEINTRTLKINIFLMKFKMRKLGDAGKAMAVNMEK